MDNKFSLKFSQEEGILLLTSARLLDKLVAGVTIHAKERDELIHEIIDKLSMAISPELASMSDELANAIVESVLGCDEQDDIDFCMQDSESDPEFVEATPDNASYNFPIYSTDLSLPVLQKALKDHHSVSVQYYSFARESVDALTLNPLKVNLDENVWKMVAYCHELDQALIFRVDRIKEVTETARKFEAPKELKNNKSSTFAVYR
ncbi:MAG TPA: WYL domain-containing protein [Oculatellaceae cyanobacterium]